MSKRPIGRHFSCSRSIVYSDASDLGVGGVVKDHEGVICHLPWTANEMFRSSTWRELKAVYICLSSFSVVLSGRAVQWFTDNRNIPSIISNGSMKRDLHEFSLSIFQLVLRNGIDLQVDWIPRSLNEHADAISRIVDFDDWGVSFEFFRLVDNIWGPHSVDRFANSHNRKLPRCFSRFWNPDSEGVDAFCFDWAGENNWLVPRVIKHLFVCRSMGTLIVPKWVSAPFWPMLFGPHSPFSVFVKETIVYTDVSNFFFRALQSLFLMALI